MHQPVRSTIPARELRAGDTVFDWTLGPRRVKRVDVVDGQPPLLDGAEPRPLVRVVMPDEHPRLGSIDATRYYEAAALVAVERGWELVDVGRQPVQSIEGAHDGHPV